MGRDAATPEIPPQTEQDPAGLVRELRAQVLQFSDELAGMRLQLNVAERALLMAGWADAKDDPVYAEAARKLRQDWAVLAGEWFTTREAHPEMTEEWIGGLAGSQGQPDG